MKLILTACLLTFYINMNAQNLPYHQIPDAPETYESGNVLARMIDGLGYRYYWATENLTEKDLAYKPSKDARTTGETLEHLYGLSLTIVNATTNTPNIRPMNFSVLDATEMRQQTLENLKKASDNLRGLKKREIKKLKVIFQRGEKSSEFPYWNMINGPIADAIYHTGQVVAFRRASGNPINPKVNVFMGKTRD